ncbi:MAG: hypothetical protein M1814_001260 [Vezdaea aestivalis]|nr:MAG: hypothetical protein M1814_001260 [Vezdaea aestivalis]
MSQFTDADWVASISASESPSSISGLPSTYGAYNDPYMTPPMPFVNDPNQLSVSHASPPPDFSRPRSSSGIYAHDPEFVFPSGGLRIHNAGVDDISFPPSPYKTAESPLPVHTPAFTTGSSIDFSPQLAAISTPRPLSRTPSIRSHPVPIAPNPAGVYKNRALTNKRARDDDSPEMSIKRRRRSTTPLPPSVELNAEERLLLKLKDEESLAWKEIAARFSSELNKPSQVPALQMRYKRLREKMRVWTDKDINALMEAREYWEKQKWEIISNRMVDNGIDEKWPAKYCLRKWESMHPEMGLESLPANLYHPYSERGTPELVDTPRHY